MFTDAELAYLAATSLGRLATVQSSGQPQASPVAFAWNPTTSSIDIGGYRMATTQKFKNIESNDRVALVVDDIVSTDPWVVRCLEIRGRAEALRDPGDSVVVLGDKAIIRIHPTRIISWGVDPDAPGRRNVGDRTPSQDGSN